MSFSRKDIEELKPAIERCAQKLLGSDNSAIVNLALTCLERGYDKKKASSKIATMVGESQANKFTDKLFSLYDDYLNMVVQSEKKRKREPLVEEEQVDNKKTKVEGLEGAAQVPNTFGEFTADKIKEMMANAQKMIQERMNKMNLVAPQVASSVPANQQQALIADASDKLKRANELQARIQARLSSSGLNNIMGQAPVAPMTGPTPVILDEYGRTIDPTTGQAVQLQLHTPTLKANIRAKKREQFRSGQEKEEMGHSKFFDFRLNAKPVMRTKKTFKFFEPGKFEKIGQRMRTKAHLEKLQNEVSLAAKKTGIATAAKLAIIQPKQESPDEVPEVEWWDAIILNTETYPEPSELPEQPSPPSEERNLPIHYEVITNLVEHPIQMKPPVEKYKHIELQTMLTKKERKKMRKQNRSEIQKEYQEKIRLGLLPPPEPKVRMANLMRVLGTEAVQDPTKVEAHVRAQMAKRQKAHEDANAARKLTKEQRREKKIRKIKEDTSNGVVVSVYRVGDLTSPKKKFKVEANANQLFMTGIVILHKDCNVIVVEGGPKQQKKFRKLVMNRMKWGDDKNRPDNDDDDDEEETETAKTNDCRLIWEGTVKNRAFGEIKIKLCPTEAFAREQFRKHSVEHYWDLAFSSTILETTLSSST